MINMYHLDGDDLVLTHYCAGGNQPHMKLDRASATSGKLQFDFIGGTNLDEVVERGRPTYPMDSRQKVPRRISRSRSVTRSGSFSRRILTVARASAVRGRISAPSQAKCSDHS